MCQDNDEPYVPNEHTVKLDVEQWRKLNMGVPDRDPLLVEREKMHGSFQRTASIAQALKSALDYNQMDNRQCEALDLICTKIARIVSGNAKEPDHWLDIAGYAKLGAEACGE